ncbi:diphthine--ammonia ligase [Panacibacter ginsenosidivorans]|uniref:Diphthine--ammonia ligase n=2 Tax=Panacibacter ginsenosidivorans TaxID=1813871 RepID=A0A5B8VFD2_9BACT|nr:diphthine--ammonia ligase [Panacibacter ginsenosidivorans]
MNWSGGKDSSLCLYKVFQSGNYNIAHLLTSVNAVHDRISMHGVRRSLLEAQASSIGIPLTTIELPEEPGMEEYENAMLQKVNELKQTGCTHAIFGDIFLEDLKNYREQKLANAGVECSFPLWKINTTELVHEFIELGFKSIIVCINEQYLDKNFCGRIIDEDFINDLPKNVDPCGENGEFHSFVFDGPIFKKPIPFTKGEIVYKTYHAPKTSNETKPDYGFYFCDLLPA